LAVGSVIDAKNFNAAAAAIPGDTPWILLTQKLNPFKRPALLEQY